MFDTFCYCCKKEGEMHRCAGCQHAFYCSKTCQKQHWKKHKPNCIKMCSLHELFDACRRDEWPDLFAAFDYGFENMRIYHGDVVSPDGLKAEHILLGLYEMIARDIVVQETENTSVHRVLNSFGASKKMILKAYEKNALDDFLHRYIKDVIDQYGDKNPENYCFKWIQNKLVIGPTRPLLSDTVALTEEQQKQWRSDIHSKYYG